MIEQVAGLMYVAIVISRIVGLQLARETVTTTGLAADAHAPRRMPEKLGHAGFDSHPHDAVSGPVAAFRQRVEDVSAPSGVGRRQRGVVSPGEITCRGRRPEDEEATDAQSTPFGLFERLRLLGDPAELLLEPPQLRLRLPMTRRRDARAERTMSATPRVDAGVGTSSRAVHDLERLLNNASIMGAWNRS